MPQTDTGERVIPVVDFPSRDGLIVMHLLEKEPDRRYKSAETLAGDLARCARRLARRGAGRRARRSASRRCPAPRES